MITSYVVGLVLGAALATVLIYLLSVIYGPVMVSEDDYEEWRNS